MLTREPAPLGAFDPHLAPFEAFSRRALSKELDARYASAREMSDDLLRIARGEAPVTIAVAAHATSAVAADATSDVAAQHGAFTREQRLVPVNSRGELPRIPAVDPSASPASAEWSAPPAPQAVGTMPSGVQRQALDALSGTVPMSPRGGFEPQAMPGAGTMLAPQSPPLATPSRAAEAAPAPHVPKHATSPSGFQPSAPHVPSAPSPLESARGQDDGDGAGGPLPWILLGVALLGALVAAVVWALA